MTIKNEFKENIEDEEERYRDKTVEINQMLNCLCSSVSINTERLDNSLISAVSKVNTASFGAEVNE